MEYINNLSDIEVCVQFKDSAGVNMAPPAYNFDVEFFTRPEYKVVKASQVAGALTNCKIQNGKLYCFFNAPALGKGQLYQRTTLYLPNNDFSDANHKQVETIALDAQIV